MNCQKCYEYHKLNKFYFQLKLLYTFEKKKEKNKKEEEKTRLTQQKKRCMDNRNPYFKLFKLGALIALLGKFLSGGSFSMRVTRF